MSDLSEPAVLKRLLAGPVAVQVAAGTRRLEPEVCRGWAPEYAGGRLTVVLLDAQTEALRRAMLETRKVAVNATDPLTFDSLQFKGELVELCEPDATARAVATERIEQFIGALRGAGIVRNGSQGVAHPGLARRMVIAVHQIFDQTPGPGAGRRLGAP